MAKSKLPRHYLLLGALLLGTVLGLALHSQADHPALQWLNANVLYVIGQVFLRLLFMIVVPLIFSALVLGVYELGKAHGLGQVVARTLTFTVVASTISVLIGVSLTNLVRPGAGFTIDTSLIAARGSDLATIEANAQKTQPLAESLISLVPKNPIDSMSRALSGEMIPLMVFALIFGLALALTVGRRRAEGSAQPALVQVLEQIVETSMKIVDWAMKLAPLAVFSIVFGTMFKHGSGILGSLALYVGVVVGGLLIQQFVVYTALLKTFTRWKPLEFFRATRDVLLYAFSTASSNATLPLSLETAEHKLKLPPQISRFVLTVGATANQNGSALFEGVTVLFLAQVYGIHLSLGQQFTVVFTAILAGIGTAGVPGGSLPMVAVLLQTVGVPAEGLGLILGVDRFLDMCRTTLNVSGDLVMSALVAGKRPRA